jgi:hypothetical protein
MSTSTNGNGRPSNYKPTHCERVIKLGRQGKSLHQMSAALGVCFGTLNAWRDKYPEFQAALTRARELAQAWWENEGQKGIWSRDFNANGYRLQMLNRFPETWRDKPDVAVSLHNGITVDTHKPVEAWGRAELRAELERRNALPKIPAVKIPINTERNGHG